MTTRGQRLNAPGGDVGGGNLTNGAEAGSAYLNLNNGPGDSNWYYGARDGNKAQCLKGLLAAGAITCRRAAVPHPQGSK